VFNLEDDKHTKLIKDGPIDRMPAADPGDEPEKPENRLDSEEIGDLHGRLVSFYRQELDRQSENRMQQAVDEDYYDHAQWTEEEAKILKDRGQAPIVYNVIAQTLNWIIGSEKRGRTDFKILPRGKEDAKPAEGKTKYLKYLSDVNRTPFHRSRAFEDAAKVGIGWIEVGAQDEDDGEPIYMRYESWRNMLWDSASTEIDGSDMRYQFRSKWVDEDVAMALFPDRAEQVKNSVTDYVSAGSNDLSDGDEAMDQAEMSMEDSGANGTVNVHRRRRVRLIEAWFRMPATVKRIRGGMFSGEVYEDDNANHKEQIALGKAVLTEKVMMRTRMAIMTPSEMLYEGPSPYRHNRFKFVPVWGYRRGRDGLPYGIIRGLRDIQDDINKRASKALHILSTNKVIMDEGALPDGMSVDEFVEEVSRPDAVLVVKAGKRMELNVDRELAPAHLDLMSRNISMIQQVGGVTDELMGRTTNATSGVAVKARQEQGSVATNKLFDNLRLAVQMEGELELSLMEQFVTDEKAFRITNMRGTPEFVTLNDGLPENDVTRTKADFVISEADWRATIRQAANEQLTDMMMKMPPQVALVMLDLVIEGMDIENREELVKRVRQINGMRDPDATEPTPEEQEAAQAKAIEAQAQEAMFKTELALKEAEVALKQAQANKADADADRAKRQMIGDSMTAAVAAMEAATAVVTMPTIAKVADNLLQEAGWKDIHTAAGGLPPMPQPMPPAPAPMQQPPDAPNGMVPDQTQLQPQ
jgi:hypothetical protein